MSRSRLLFCFALICSIGCEERDPSPNTRRVLIDEFAQAERRSFDIMPRAHAHGIMIDECVALDADGGTIVLAETRANFVTIVRELEKQHKNTAFETVATLLKEKTPSAIGCLQVQLAAFDPSSNRYLYVCRLDSDNHNLVEATVEVVVENGTCRTVEFNIHINT